MFQPIPSHHNANELTKCKRQQLALFYAFQKSKFVKNFHLASIANILILLDISTVGVDV